MCPMCCLACVYLTCRGLPKKLRFLFKTCFSDKPQYLEEDADLIVIEDNADHFVTCKL